MSVLKKAHMTHDRITLIFFPHRCVILTTFLSMVFRTRSLQYKRTFNKFAIYIHIEPVSMLWYGHIFYTYK